MNAKTICRLGLVLLTIIPLLFSQSVRAASLPVVPFSIPLIDLDAERQRQVIIDREPGQYLGQLLVPALQFGR